MFNSGKLVKTVGFLLACVFFLSGLNRAQSQGTLRITYNPMPFNLPSIIERHQGFGRHQSLELDYKTFLIGYAMTEAMAARELDVATVMGATSFITSASGGRNIKVLSVYSKAPKAFALATTKEQGLTTKTLQGKRIAVPLGTEAHYLLARILEEQGLSLQDVELVNLLIPDGLAALRSRHVDGAMVVEPVMSKLVQAGQIQVIRDGEGLIDGLTLTVVRGDYEDGEALQAYNQAYRQSLEFIVTNYEEALVIAAEELKLPLEIVEQVAPKYTFHSSITEEDLNTLGKIVDFLFNEGVIRRSVDVTSLLYSSN